MSNLIQIQDNLIATINASAARWGVTSHTHYDRCDCGHYGRTRRGAVRSARRALTNLGFEEEQITTALRDAIDVAELQLQAD